jgi:hypothetical protein
MKTKVSLLLIACCIAVFACTKSSNKPEQNQQPEPLPQVASSTVKYAVHFGLGNLDVVENGRLGKREVPASSFLRYIFYGAYDS